MITADQDDQNARVQSQHASFQHASHLIADIRDFQSLGTPLLMFLDPVPGNRSSQQRPDLSVSAKAAMEQ